PDRRRARQRDRGPRFAAPLSVRGNRARVAPAGAVRPAGRGLDQAVARVAAVAVDRRRLVRRLPLPLRGAGAAQELGLRIAGGRRVGVPVVPGGPRGGARDRGGELVRLRAPAAVAQATRVGPSDGASCPTSSTRTHG